MNKGSLSGIILIGTFVCAMGAILYRTGGNFEIAKERHNQETSVGQVQGGSRKNKRKPSHKKRKTNKRQNKK